MTLFAGITDRVNKLLWRADVPPRWRPATIAFGALRLVVVIVRAARDPSLNLRAMGLVYSTLLSIVPLLAVSFSVLKAFGAHYRIEPFLAQALDWRRLFRRFGPHWRVLLSHLVLFGFVYPGEIRRIPDVVMRALLRRLDHEQTADPPADRICRGTLISREQYLVDVECWGYADARLLPGGSMTPEDAAIWTEAIGDKGTG